MHTAPMPRLRIAPRRRRRRWDLLFMYVVAGVIGASGGWTAGAVLAQSRVVEPPPITAVPTLTPDQLRGL
ncbi:MAG: hypothetical protein ACRCZP_00375 [Phycicoccus sp.]